MGRAPGAGAVSWAIPMLAFALAGSLVAAAEGGAHADSLVEAGRRIYEEGLLPSGESLKGIRRGGFEAVGREVACVLCHQRSGLGLTEGAVPVPPVSSPALFRNERPLTLGRTPLLAPRMQLQDYHFRTRPPYDDDTLARAIREGLSPTGHVFNYLMPRYPLSEDAMAALLAYLRQLSDRPSPGVNGQIAHIATVVAPAMDPARRESYLGVLQACVAERHPELEGEAPPGYLPWRLHVWDLVGPPETWGQQLQEHYVRQPVFALVSGLGSDQWSPVEAFCESNRIPCLFPNLEVPGTPTGGRYSFYFYKGVLLEAEVAARYLKDRRARLGISRVVQVSGADGSGIRAAAALRSALDGAGIGVEDRVLTGSQGDVGGSPLEGLTPADALVLWLRGPDVAALSAAAPPPAAGVVLVSGLLGGEEKAPLSAAWKGRALLIYPFDPPYRWERRMAYNLRTWLDQHGLPRADERLQGNTLAACNLLSEGMLRLRGRYLRDYLVEWTENYPTAMGNAPAPQAFPRFSLGPGQRFSSKGAYIARFAPADPSRLERVEDWIVP
jgi:hypothetical protein